MTPTERKRLKLKTWRPKAHQLALLHVPEHARDQIRKRIEPWLDKLADIDGQDVAVKPCDCWNIAQALVVTAKDVNVIYVEGVWTRPWQLENGDDPPCPHAWVTVDGFLVDLIAEFYAWRTLGDDSDWLYEPLKKYSHAELFDTLPRFGKGFDISTHLWFENGGFDLWLEDGGKAKLLTVKKEELVEYGSKIPFQPAIDRLVERERTILNVP